MEKTISEMNHFSLKYANTHAITDQSLKFPMDIQVN